MTLKRSLPTACTLVSLLAATCLAHPVFDARSIVNGASFIPSELPGGKIARGSIFSIIGAELGPEEPVAARTFPLPTRMAGVSIEISQGGLTVDAILLYVSESQINAIMPSNAPLGEAIITVSFGGEENDFPVAIQIVETSAGIFTIHSSGAGPAVIQNFISEAEQPLNSLRSSARPGQFVTLWGTGLGAIAAPDDLAPPAGNLAPDLTVLVGGREAERVLYAGRSPCCAGVDQIVFQVPGDAPLGCYVPVLVGGNGGWSNAASMSIDPGGATCSDPLNPFLAAGGAAGGATLGAVTLAREALLAGAAGDALEVTDTGSAAFQTTANSPWFFSHLLSVPAMGTCAAYTFRNQPVGLPNPPPPMPLDGGLQLIVRGPNGARAIPQTQPGFYAALFANSTVPPYLDAGLYTIEPQAGPADARIDAEIELLPPLTWTNQAEISTVDRDQGVTVNWSGGDPAREYARVMGVSQNFPDPKNNVSAVFLCTASIEAGTYTVPPPFLANLPAGLAAPDPRGFLFVGAAALPSAATVTVEELDYGLVTYHSMTGKAVTYD